MPRSKLNDPDNSLRHWLDWLLGGGNAHVSFDVAVRGFPAKLRGAKVPALPHTAWELLEHMRIAQWDILDFSRNPKYKQRPWPGGYWPTHSAPKKGEWEKAVRDFRAYLSEFRKVIADPRVDLYVPFPWGDGQTLLREALLIADHNAYHLGQLVLVRRALGAWED